MVKDDSGAVVRVAGDVPDGALVRVRLSEGEFHARREPKVET